MNKTFNSLRDIRKYCGDMLENYECRFYGFGDHEEFVAAVADKMRAHLYGTGWKYGEPTPAISDEFFDENFLECFNG